MLAKNYTQRTQALTAFNKETTVCLYNRFDGETSTRIVPAGFDKVIDFVNVLNQNSWNDFEIMWWDYRYLTKQEIEDRY